MVAEARLAVNRLLAVVGHRDDEWAMEWLSLVDCRRGVGIQKVLLEGGDASVNGNASRRWVWAAGSKRRKVGW